MISPNFIYDFVLLIFVRYFTYKSNFIEVATYNKITYVGDMMDDREKVIEAFRNSEDPLNAKKVSELSGVEKKEVDKIMKELKKDETIVSPKRCYWTLAEK